MSVVAHAAICGESKREGVELGPPFKYSEAAS